MRLAQAPKCHVMTDGLIVREHATIAENDRFVAILTRDRGLIRAAARGARSVKSRSCAATQLLCYSRLSLVPGRDKYIIEDAQPQELFFPLRQDLERMTLAQYFCELALHLTPVEAPAEEHLRLFLNALHYLAQGERDPLLIKAIVEGRLMCLEGYMPDLTGCAECGRTDGAAFVFSPSGGTLCCPDHPAPPDAMPLTSGVLTALRHILYGDFARCFAFSLPPEDTAELARVTQRFLLVQGQRRYATLEMYRTLRTELT